MFTRPVRQTILAALALATVAVAQNSPADGSFQVRYAANLTSQAPVVIYSNSGTPAPGFDSSNFYQPNIDPMCLVAESLAQQFVASTTGVLQTVVLPLSSSDVASATFELLTNTGAPPGSPGTLIDTVTFTGITAAPTLITANSTLHPPLTAGTPYWLRGVAPPCSPGNFVRYTWYWASPIFFGPIETHGVVFPTAAQSAFALNGLAPVDPVVNFTNTGANNAQDICVNTYTFAPDEQLISCCSCRVTRNAFWSVGVRRDLTSNALTPAGKLRRDQVAGDRGSRLGRLRSRKSWHSRTRLGRMGDHYAPVGRDFRGSLFRGDAVHKFDAE